MIVILESPTGKRKWKIEPYDNGLCFKISKTPIGIVDVDGVLRNRDGKEIKQGWLDCRLYPTKLEHAVEKVVDLMLADPEDSVTVEFHGIDMKTGMNKIFKKWLKDTMVMLEGECE